MPYAMLITILWVDAQSQSDKLWKGETKPFNEFNIYLTLIHLIEIKDYRGCITTLHSIKDLVLGPFPKTER